MKVAVIPARGGSKRILRKNVREFCGRPMIGWALMAARKSECFDRILVSTDDAAIAETARQLGAETPFRRPAELADDYTGTVEVMCHAVDWLERHGNSTAEACCIYPTAPFVEGKDIQRGLEALRSGDFSYAISVTTFPFPIQRALRLLSGGGIGMFYPEYRKTRSQDLEAAYHDAAQFYWGRGEAWRAQRALFDSDSVAIMLPRYRVQDIDTPEDWERAELIFRALYGWEQG